MPFFSFLGRLALSVFISAFLVTATPLISTNQDGSKTVIAHFIVGNAYPYTMSDWKNGRFSSLLLYDSF